MMREGAVRGVEYYCRGRFDKWEAQKKWTVKWQMSVDSVGGELDGRDERI